MIGGAHAARDPTTQLLIGPPAAAAPAHSIAALHHAAASPALATPAPSTMATNHTMYNPYLGAGLQQGAATVPQQIYTTGGQIIADPQAAAMQQTLLNAQAQQAATAGSM